MDYQSTRNKNISVTSAQAVKQGISSEGGLFVPSDIPSVTSEEIEKLASFSYVDRAKYIL